MKAMFFSACPLILLCTASHAQLQPAFTITNGSVSLKAQQVPSYGVVLKSIFENATPTTKYSFQTADLWQVELRDPSSHAIHTIKPTDCSFAFSISKTADSFTAVWSQVDPPPPFPNGLTFSVTMNFSIAAGDFVAQVTTNVDASATGMSLYALTAPRLTVLAGQHGASQSEALISPYGEGLLVRNPLAGFVPQSLGRLTSPSRDVSMQFLSYYNENDTAHGPNLFLGTRDGGSPEYGYYKQFEGTRVPSVNPTGFLFDLRQVPENNLVASQFSSPFPYVIGILEGDWFDAAIAYRAWVTGNGGRPWVHDGKMYANGNYSSYLKNAVTFGVYGLDTCPITIQCTPNNIQSFSYQFSVWDQWKDELDDEKALLGLASLPSPLLPLAAMHWEWEKGAFGGMFGEWAPERPEYLDVVDDVAADYVVCPYFENRVYSAQAQGFQDGQVGQQMRHMYGALYLNAYDHLIIDENGLPVPSGTSVLGTHDYDCDESPSCSAPQTTYELDLASDFCRDLTRSWAQDLQGLGAKGIYLDTFTANPPLLTYVAHAGHSQVGGGNWYVKRMIDLVRKVREDRAASDPDFYIQSEGVNEMFVKDVGLVFGQTADNIAAQVSNVFVLPLYATVYHDYQRVFRGVPLNAGADLVSSDDPVKFAEARRFYAANLFLGMAPSIGSKGMLTRLSDYYFDTTNHPNYSKFLQSVMADVDVLKTTLAHDYVALGTRLRDPQVTVQSTLVSDFSLAAPYGLSQPLVYVSAYGREDKQGFAILLTNWTDSGDTGYSGGDRSVTLTVDPQRFGCSYGNYRLHYIQSFTGPFAPVTVALSAPVTGPLTVPELTTILLVYEKL